MSSIALHSKLLRLLPVEEFDYLSHLQLADGVCVIAEYQCNMFWKKPSLFASESQQNLEFIIHIATVFCKSCNVCAISAVSRYFCLRCECLSVIYS